MSVGADEEMVMVPAFSAQVDVVPRTKSLPAEQDQRGRGQPVGQQYGKKPLNQECFAHIARRRGSLEGGLGGCSDPIEQTDADSSCNPFCRLNHTA